MRNLDRANYTVIKDFDHNMILPISKIPVKYKKGDKLNLRVNSELAKDFLDKGYIEKVKD